MLRIKKISEVLGKPVYTDAGDFIGQVEEVNLLDNKIQGWRIRVTPSVSAKIGGARGVIVPHNFIKAVGDIFIVSKAALPIREEVEEGEESVSEEEMPVY